MEVVSLEDAESAAQRPFDFPVTALGRGTARYGYNPKLVPWLLKNGPRFDAVVLHGLWNYSSYGSWRALRHLNVPYFIFTHGMMDPWFREAHQSKHLAKQLFWLLAEGRVLRDAEAVLFTSEEERLRARNVFRGYTYNESVVLYGTGGPPGDPTGDIQEFSSGYPELDGKKYLLFLSRIHPKKGCDLLLRAFARCQDVIPRDLDLVMAGPDQVGWVRELKTLAANLGIFDRVHWPGMLQGRQKWGAFRRAEAAILPSHQENFGIAVAEAMACSTPVLISDKVNIWREVMKAEAGLVEADTAGGTERLIRGFFAMSEQERQRMRGSARNGFLQYFEIEAAGLDLMLKIGFARS